ncbi:hypothetical protein [Methylobacterium sp. CCH5-D2]|uniref:DUF6894 family protein n=1 Tax=Methylobacterium sp. CCH5-D2 TaxID=1768765 RepID=UPI0012E3D4C2|nr:hypothetical protein [Methylobacterium sp. CCH5-D2]
MPLFYFHVVTPDDLTLHDGVGLDLPDRFTAFEAGLQAAHRYEGYARFGNEIVPGWYVEVTTEGGELCWRFPIDGRRP